MGKAIKAHDTSAIWVVEPHPNSRNLFWTGGDDGQVIQWTDTFKQ